MCCPSREKPKTAETDQGLAGQAGVAVRLVTVTQANTVGLCWQQLKAGWKLLPVAKQISQHSPGPAANAASVLTISHARLTDLSQNRDKSDAYESR